jgi:hypothetical protein
MFSPERRMGAAALTQRFGIRGSAMATELEPIVGDWYSYRGRDFTVIDVDEDGGFVEIQYANGNVQQVDLNAWYDMDLEPSEQPDDWESGVAEDTESSDPGSPRGSRWGDDEDDEEDIEEDTDDDDVDDDEDDDDDDEEDDDDWDDEDEEEDELEGEWRDRRSDEDDSWDEH